MAPASSIFVFTFCLDALEGGVSSETPPRVTVAPLSGGRPWHFAIKTSEGFDDGLRVQCRRQSPTAASLSPCHTRSLKVERALKSPGGLLTTVPLESGGSLPIDSSPFLPAWKAEQHGHPLVSSIPGESDGTSRQGFLAREGTLESSVEQSTLSVGTGTPPSFLSSSRRYICRARLPAVSSNSGQEAWKRGRLLYRRGFYEAGQQEEDISLRSCSSRIVLSAAGRTGMALLGYQVKPRQRVVGSPVAKQNHLRSKRSACHRPRLNTHRRRFSSGYGSESG